MNSLSMFARVMLDGSTGRRAGMAVAQVVLLGIVGCTPDVKRTRVTPYLDYPAGYSVDAPRAVAGLRIEEVPNDKAVVVFFRDDQDAWNLSASILDNGAPVSVLMAYTHVVYQTQPGAHRFAGMCTGNRAAVIDAELSPGKVYIVGFRVSGVMLMSWRFQAITPESAEWSRLPAFFAESVQVHPNPAGAAWFASKLPELTRRADQVLADGDEKTRAPIPASAGVSLDALTWVK